MCYTIISQKIKGINEILHIYLGMEDHTMRVLINETKQVSNILQHNGSKKEVSELLKEKIEEIIMNDKTITIVMVNSLSECRNTFHIEDFEVDKKHIHICVNNFELHIAFENATDMKYNNDYDEEIIIQYGDNEIIFYF